MHCRNVVVRLFIAVVAASLSATVQADDWPQWQGPNRDGKSQETDLLQQWPSEGPPRVWLFEDCGVGYGGPAIVDGKMYIMGSRDGIEQLICLNANNGREQWAINLGEEYDNGWGNGPRGTPTIVDGRIYALPAKGNLTCIDLASGDVVWQTSLLDELGGTLPNWGYSESPLVVGNRIYCTPGGDQGAVAALDAANGKVVWRSADVKDEAHYSSIMTQTIDGQTSLVQLLVSQLVGLDIESGEVRWSEGWPGRVAVVPTPTISESKVYVTSGYGVGCMLVDVADGGSAEKVYENKVMKCHHGGVILLDGHLYGHSDSVGWVCQNLATGETVWRDRDELGKGAISYADGRFYCLSEDEGEVALISATTEGWEEHGRFQLQPQTQIRKDRGKIWTHPVISNGRLYLRDQDLVYCFDIRDTNTSANAGATRK